MARRVAYWKEALAKGFPSLLPTLSLLTLVLGGSALVAIKFGAANIGWAVAILLAGLLLLALEGAAKIGAERDRLREREEDAKAQGHAQLKADLRAFENRMVALILWWSRLRPSGPDRALQLDSVTKETRLIGVPPTPEQFKHDQEAKSRWLNDHLQDALDLCDRLVDGGYASREDRHWIANATERSEVVDVYEHFATWRAWVNLGIPRAKLIKLGIAKEPEQEQDS